MKENAARSRRHPVRFWFSVCAAALLVAGTLILAALPMAMEWGAKKFLVDSGARSAEIMDVDFNPFMGNLTVFGLTAVGSNGDRVDVERFQTRIRLRSLFKKRLHLISLGIAGVRADIRHSEDGSLTVGGLSFGPGPGSATVEQPAEGEKTWGFGIDSVECADIRFHLVASGFDETVLIDRLRLDNFATWSPDQSGKYQLLAGLKGTNLELSGTARPFSSKTDLALRFAFRGLPLDMLTPYLHESGITSLSGVLSGQGEIDLSIIRERLTGAQKAAFSRSADVLFSMTLDDSQVRLISGDSPVEIGQEAFSLQVAGSYSDTGSFSPDNFVTKTEMTIERFRLSGDDNPSAILSARKIDVKNLETEGREKIRAENISISEIDVLPRHPKSVQEGEPRQVVHLKDLTLDNISLEKMSFLRLGEVGLGSLSAWILRKEGGAFEALDLLAGTLSGESPATSENLGSEAGQERSPLKLMVGRLSLTGENTFTFRDLDVRPPMTFEMDSLNLEVVDFQTDGPEGRATFSFNAKVGKYTNLSAHGNIFAPWDKPDLDARIGVKAMDLPPLTPYTDRYVGYILNSGHLDLDMDIEIVQGALKTRTDILVNRIEMNPVKEEDELRANDRLGIPVKTALSLLKDKNDNIKLSLPIDGNLNDPKFRISDIVLKVTGNALKKGVSAFYGPLGASLLTGGLLPPGTFSLLGQVFKGSAMISFDPVIFEPLATELSEKDRGFLDQLSTKLSQKPDTRLLLCGKVTRRDIMALRLSQIISVPPTDAARPVEQAATGPAEALADDLSPAAGQEVADKEASSMPPEPPSVEEAPLSDKEKEQLIEIAKLRAMAVKDYLAENGGLDPERLFVCYSDVEKEVDGPPPRVELSI